MVDGGEERAEAGARFFFVGGCTMPPKYYV
jgi:hypothetical protein